MGKKDTKEQFIEKARAKHGDRYGYDQVVYIDNRTEIKIYCIECNSYFYQIPADHKSGSGCRRCSQKAFADRCRDTVDDFKRKAIEKHGDQYGYDQVVYVNSQTKVDIYCNRCKKIFSQKPNSHLNGSGCRSCFYFSAGDKRKLGNVEFIKRAKRIHGNKYGYDQVEYTDYFTTVNIYCKSCAIVFQKTPAQHLGGRSKGCPLCSNKEISQRFTKTRDEFIEDAVRVHGNRYGYDAISYVGCFEKVSILCSLCGKHFNQRPSDHINGSGCPYCKESRGERMIVRILDRLEIRYKREHADRKNWTGYSFEWDFYIPYHHSIVEYHGRQHFEFVSRFHKNDQGFAKQLEKDRLRVEYAKSIGCKYLAIAYTVTQDGQAEQMIRDFLAL